MNAKKMIASVLLAAALVGIPAGVASASSVPPSVASRAAAHRAAVLATPRTFAYAGDSTTAMPTSWMHQVKDTTLTNVGGFAKGGYTSTQVLENIQPGTADVLVIMIGVNDIPQQIPTSTTLANIEAIVAKFSGAKDVLVAAIVPSNLTNSGIDHLNRQELGAQLNESLRSFAVSHGWYFGDPDTDFRRANNAYKLHANISDGVHPNARSFGQMAVRLSQFIHFAAA
jgi:lysophospholipase L1-like esterase